MQKEDEFLRNYLSLYLKQKNGTKTSVGFELSFELNLIKFSEPIGRYLFILIINSYYIILLLK